MKSKPLVMNELSISTDEFEIDFHFGNNITILSGPAGSGKTVVYHIIREFEPENTLCINYENVNISETILQASGKLIVIDNADVMIDDVLRKYISLDDKNQYILIGRNPKNLFATGDNFYVLRSHEYKGKTMFTLSKAI